MTWKYQDFKEILTLDLRACFLGHPVLRTRIRDADAADTSDESNTYVSIFFLSKKATQKYCHSELTFFRTYHTLHMRLLAIYMHSMKYQLWTIIIFWYYLYPDCLSVRLFFPFVRLYIVANISFDKINSFQYNLHMMCWILCPHAKSFHP